MKHLRENRMSGSTQRLLESVGRELEGLQRARVSGRRLTKWESETRAFRAASLRQLEAMKGGDVE